MVLFAINDFAVFAYVNVWKYVGGYVAAAASSRRCGKLMNKIIEKVEKCEIDLLRAGVVWWWAINAIGGGQAEANGSFILNQIDIKPSFCLASVVECFFFREELG